MPDIVKVLPDHVANQIAAGEVIQRPASVVKELLDNAIDAGATQISVIIADAGSSLIQVVDNGKGMSETDARLCWERHATSKINRVEDLFNLSTMGFRGEALASIASVAWVEMKTKRKEDPSGTYILIEGSVVKKQEPEATSNGTSIAVKNLFYNIPARRSFLKSNAVEFKHIVEEFTRCALANPSIGLELFHQNELHLSLKSSTLQERIIELFQVKDSSLLYEISEQTTVVSVNGFVGSPQIAKRLRGEQYLFVNNRFIKDAYLNHAIVNAYEQLITKEQFPLYVLHLTLNPAAIDVNIHPTKTEIKFEDDKNIYQILRAVVKKALGGIMQMPTDQNFDDNRFVHAELNKLEANAKLNFATVGNSGELNRNTNFKDQYSLSRQKNKNWDVLFSNLPEIEPEVSAENNTLDLQEQESKKFFQLHLQFIVTQIKSGLMLINQQLAHERILFERYLNALKNTPIASQQLLFPRTVMLNPIDEALMVELLPQINALGFNINHFGKQTFIINGLPAEFHLDNEKKLIEEIIESFKYSSDGVKNKNIQLAKVLSKETAIKSGTKLTPDEMNSLIDELFACSEPNLSPEGKPCIKVLSLTEITEMF